MTEYNHRGNATNPSEIHAITLTRIGAVALFNIKGEMAAYSESSLNDAYRQAVGQETGKILFNFNGCAYITSAGIAIFIQILAQAVKRNQLIGITGLSKHFIKIFNMLGITKFAEIHDDLQEAVDSLNACEISMANN